MRKIFGPSVVAAVVFVTGCIAQVSTAAPVSAALFSWSDVKPTVGQSVKVSDLVGVNVKGKLKYKVSGVCKLRNGTVSFVGSGRCRVTVLLSQKSGKKMVRSSRFFSVAQNVVCDPSVAHPKGAFKFAPKLDDSLPVKWREEFAVILANLQEVAPISSCLHDFKDTETGNNSVKSPMSIYAWSNTVSNPWPEEKPGMEGTSISGNGSDTWMILEMRSDDLAVGNLQQYAVIAHEYWHVYQRGAWMADSPPGGSGWPVWMWEGGAGVVQNLYTAEHYGSSDFDNNLSPVIATALSNPSDFELYDRDGGAAQGKSDINGTTQTFMVLALAKELQTTLGLTEVKAFALALNPPAKPDSETAFFDVFGISLKDFYTSLAQYPAVESGEDWFEGKVVKASVVMPSKDLTLTAILQPTG